MSESRWRKVRENTVPVLLGTLIVAMFHTTASTHGRMADMENRLGERMHRMERELSDRIHGVERELSDRIHGVEKRLSDRITRLETLMEGHLEVHSGRTENRGGG